MTSQSQISRLFGLTPLRTSSERRRRNDRLGSADGRELDRPSRSAGWEPDGVKQTQFPRFWPENQDLRRTARPIPSGKTPWSCEAGPCRAGGHGRDKRGAKGAKQTQLPGIATPTALPTANPGRLCRTNPIGRRRTADRVRLTKRCRRRLRETKPMCRTLK